MYMKIPITRSATAIVRNCCNPSSKLNCASSEADTDAVLPGWNIELRVAACTDHFSDPKDGDFVAGDS